MAKNSGGRGRGKGVKTISLALQGGGAHGAFTWGALLRLLEDEHLEIRAISGTSAGALNGAAVKAGLASANGAEGRRLAAANLDWVWRQMGAVNDLRLASWINQFVPGAGMISRALEYSLAYSVADAASHAVSPYLYGPAYSNPLARIVERLDFDRVCATEGPAFYVNTTRVRDGKIRVFDETEITTDVILASACLPTIFQAVQIWDAAAGRMEAYWDGGYTGNPALFPLFRGDFPDDVVIVNINPLERDELPVSPQQIENRINEISFNSSLLRELRAISFVKRMLREGRLPEGSMRDMNIHMISDDALMRTLSVATKVVPQPYVLATLRQAGYAAAERFLAEHWDAIGREGSVDLGAMFAETAAGKGTGPGPARSD